MGIVAVKIKIMPSSPEVNLKEIEEETKKLIQQKGGKNPKTKEESVAFGLNAIIVLFAWPEEKEIESLEASLKSIKNVSSVQVIDMRRAIG